MVPLGTQVRVVNQPFVFGWHDGQLYLQAYDVLEDDTRDWKKAQTKLLTKSLAARCRTRCRSSTTGRLGAGVGVCAQPRGIPVPITAADALAGADPGRGAARAEPLPDGSTWDGQSDLPMDEATFKQMFPRSSRAPARRRRRAAAATPPLPAVRPRRPPLRRPRTAAEARVSHERALGVVAADARGDRAQAG